MPLKQDVLSHVQMSCSTAKRQCLESPKGHVNNTLVPLNSKKCGEVLVTSNADKWTFVCTFCQHVTGDIGVFICHIKMEHLKDKQQQDLEKETISSNTANTKTKNTIVNDNNKQSQPNNFPAILQVTSLAGQTKERSTGEKLRHVSSSSSCAEECILPHNTPVQREQSVVNTTVKQIEEVYEVIYLNDNDNHKKPEAEDNNCIMIDDDDDEDEDNCVINEALDSSTEFSYPICEYGDDSNDDLKVIENSNEDNALIPTSSSSGSKRKRKKKIVNTQDLPYKCSYCNKGFKSKQAIYYHHRTHEKQNQLQCPLCPVSHCTEQLFVSHVLTHESSTCFPCQVCGQASPTNEKRLEHMKTHEIERPFGCTYCFRRFRKKHFLTNHLRMHCQYLCDFCPAEFSAPQAQRRPYVCPSCETLPDIRRKVEQQRSFAAKNQTLESDQE